MPTYVDVLKFEGEAPVNTIRLIKSGEFYRLGSPFACFPGAKHAIGISRFSWGRVFHRLALCKLAAPEGGDGIGVFPLCYGTGSHCIGAFFMRCGSLGNRIKIFSFFAANTPYFRPSGNRKKNFV